MRSAFILLCVVFSSGIISCQKDLSFELVNIGGPPALAAGDTLYRIQQGVSLNLDEDTIFLLSYDTEQRLVQIVDSLAQDTLTITYDTDGNLLSGNWTSGVSVNFKYSNKILEEIQTAVYGSNDEYVLEYVNGNVVKNSYYSDAGMGGPPELWQSSEFTNPAGNITSIREFDKSHTLLYQVTISSGTTLNPFKTLALLNTANHLGMDRMFGTVAAFNKNIYTGYISGPFYDAVEYTFNSKGKPTKAVVTSETPGDVLTWQFYYK